MLRGKSVRRDLLVKLRNLFGKPRDHRVVAVGVSFGDRALVEIVFNLAVEFVTLGGEALVEGTVEVARCDKHGLAAFGKPKIEDLMLPVKARFALSDTGNLLSS